MIFKNYSNIFKDLLTETEIPLIPDLPITDKEAMQAEMNPDSVNQLDLEKANLDVQSELDIDAILQRAEKYSTRIIDEILPFFRKLHNDINSGLFKDLPLKINNVAKLKEELAALAEALRGRVVDAVTSKTEPPAK